MTKSLLLSTGQAISTLPTGNALKASPLNERHKHDRIIEWAAYRTIQQRHSAFDAMAWIGFKMAVVFDNPKSKIGITKSVQVYNDLTRRYIRINWQSSHIVELELAAV